jgi:hypothetical protein
MHSSVDEFVASALAAEDVAGKRVIEAGSYDYNGTVRKMVEALDPASYLGTDVQEGPSVDLVCPAEDIAAQLGCACADVVITTEMLEHALNWRAAISGMVAALAPRGVLLLTTRSTGFPYHPNPEDYWRFSVNAMRAVMNAAELQVERLQSDPLAPGVFALARKPAGWTTPPDFPASLEAVVPGPAIRVDGFITET